MISRHEMTGNFWCIFVANKNGPYNCLKAA